MLQLDYAPISPPSEQRLETSDVPFAPLDLGSSRRRLNHKLQSQSNDGSLETVH